MSPAEEFSLSKPDIFLWLGDRRDPNLHGASGATWCKTVDETICALRTGRIVFASFDHDVQFDGRDGMTVLRWMQTNDVWPPNGVCIHSTNIDARAAMLDIVRAHYGRDFQGPDFLQW